MTNAEIILGEQIRLAEEGIIKIVGSIKAETPDGEIIEIPAYQPIHTYQAWKKLGYQVKKGEKAITKFAVWHWSAQKKKKDEDEEKAVANGRCYMKTSAFFTDEQVEKIEEDK